MTVLSYAKHALPLDHGFLTWGASTRRGCWNQFQGVLGKVTCVAVKGERNTFGQKCWPMLGGAGLLRRDQKGCWGRKRL